jgi:hypothetical protein
VQKLLERLETKGHVERDRSSHAHRFRARTDRDTLVGQRLRAHSDVDRSYTYEFCEPSPFPVRDYEATLRVTPVVDGDRAFVEWWATFECAAEERDRWTAQFNEGFAGWLHSLRGRLGG